MTSDLSRLLPATLPPGRLVGGEDGPEPLLWISDAPAPAGLWQQLHRAHPQSGLWPLLLVPLGDGADYRPWLSGELFPASASDPTLYDPDALLRRWWQQLGGTDEDAPESPPESPPEGPFEAEDAAELHAALAPFGPAWPGTAPAAAVPAGAPGIEARGLADVLLSVRDARLGLVEAGSGAEALAACGWSGPLNHEDDTAKIAAVLADWERRFGAQVIQVGFDTLELSVAVPPATLAEALPLAAEHTAFCPDLVFQGTGALTAYAERLVAAHQWSFWWD
ncbi:DUF4253 domain-containing protein [Kitasatospora sp. NPDC091276]|uniref:DUF4253 domain-containing protein n=1 Tax=Kitasatospora sp. NPDC091276 TaxID=3155300 RepID=UPI0034197C61